MIDGFEIRPVVDAATARDWEQAFVDGFPEPALQPVQPGCLLGYRSVLRFTLWSGHRRA